MEETKEFRNINELTPWEQNPRSITKQDYVRLKRQLKRLGMYKPLIITSDGTVLGGNMRFRAYKDLGIKDIWVSVVDASTEAKKLEYALSDNDIVAQYEEEELAELLMGADEELPLKDYKVSLKSISLDKLLTQFGPGEELTGEETDKEKKKITCPECGAQFYN